MPKALEIPQWRTTLLTVGGVVAVAVILSGAIAIEGGRNNFSDARRAESTAAVARMDDSQDRANEARALAQKRSYKAF